MLSVLGIQKIEELQFMYDDRLFDTDVLYELLEQYNMKNMKLYVAGKVGKFDFGTLSKFKPEVVRKQYLYNIPDWKVFKKEYFDTQMNKLVSTDREMFNRIDKMLNHVSVCKKVARLHQITHNPVQLTPEEAYSVHTVLKSRGELFDLINDFRVV